MNNFYVIEEPVSGKYLSGKEMTPESLVEFGTGVALYRSYKAATKAARNTLKQYQHYRTEWVVKVEAAGLAPTGYIDENYRADLQELRVQEVSLELVPNKSASVQLSM